jgi:hypothetical protein
LITQIAGHDIVVTKSSTELSACLNWHLDFQRQYDLNPARCHFITVSGFKTARAFRIVGANRYSPAKIKRSMALNVSLLGECRLSMSI